MSYKKTKAIEAKKARLLLAKEKMQILKDNWVEYYWYYNALTGKPYSKFNQIRLYSQNAPQGWMIPFSEVLKWNPETKKRSWEYDIKKWAITYDILFYAPVNLHDNQDEREPLKKKFFKSWKLMSISDLLIENKPASECCNFATELVNEKDIEASENDIIEFMNTIDNIE